MAPELVEELSRAVTAETNVRCRDLEQGQAQLRRDLEVAKRKLIGLYDAIADGLRTPGLKRQLEALEAEQQELERQVQAEPVSMPQLHLNLARVYREKVSDLSAALSDPEARGEAADILRQLIERIDVQADDGGHTIELTGDIVRLISLPDGQAVPDVYRSSVKVVAGRGFEPLTFRL